LFLNNGAPSFAAKSNFNGIVPKLCVGTQERPGYVPKQSVGTIKSVNWKMKDA